MFPISYRVVKNGLQECYRLTICWGVKYKVAGVKYKGLPWCLNFRQGVMTWWKCGEMTISFRVMHRVIHSFGGYCRPTADNASASGENLTLDTRCRGRLSTQSRRSLPSIAVPARAPRRPFRMPPGIAQESGFRPPRVVVAALSATFEADVDHSGPTVQAS